MIIRKNSLCNRSDDGAHTQAVLMSVYRTLRLRGRDPTKTIAAALRQLLQTGMLPSLPVETVADGCGGAAKGLVLLRRLGCAGVEVDREDRGGHKKNSKHDGPRDVGGA